MHGDDCHIPITQLDTSNFTSSKSLTKTGERNSESERQTFLIKDIAEKMSDTKMSRMMRRSSVQSGCLKLFHGKFNQFRF